MSEWHQQKPDYLGNLDGNSATEPVVESETNLDYKDMYLRCLADFQNYRKRVEKERLDSKEFANLEAVKEMLPVLDTFERACKSSDTHINVVYQCFYGMLQKLGLEPLEAWATKFDPNIHEAIEMEDVDNEKLDGIVTQEMLRGFNFKGRLLRPAMVKVGVKK